MRYMDKKGQGLLETIVALGIIMSALVAVLSLVISNLITERVADMRLQALNFAREGIEAVKNIRDSNYLSNPENVWSGLPPSENQTFKVFFNQDRSQKSLVEANEDAFIYQNLAGIYLQGENLSENHDFIKTPFSRSIMINGITCGDLGQNLQEKCNQYLQDAGVSKIGIKVDSIVSWTETGRQHEITLTEKLYDWR